MMKTSKILYAAADYIREHGWKRRNFGVDGGKMNLNPNAAYPLLAAERTQGTP